MSRRTNAFGPETALIFLHIPKTAGRTLREVLDRQFRPGTVFTRKKGRGAFGEALAGLPEAERRRIRFVRGHLNFGVHEVLPQPATYITMLREPVDRVLSIYYYRVRHKGLEASLEEYVSSQRALPVDNDQTRRLSGIDFGFGEGTPRALERAKRNLEDHVSVAGLTERFDESLILLRRAFGWRNLFYVRKNVGADRPPRDRVPGDVLRLIEERNRFDIELYRHAERLFEERLGAQDPPIDGELDRFRRRNAMFGRIYPFASPVWRGVRRLRHAVG